MPRPLRRVEGSLAGRATSARSAITWKSPQRRTPARQELRRTTAHRPPKSKIPARRGFPPPTAHRRPPTAAHWDLGCQRPSSPGAPGSPDFRSTWPRRLSDFPHPRPGVLLILLISLPKVPARRGYPRTGISVAGGPVVPARRDRQTSGRLGRGGCRPSRNPDRGFADIAEPRAPAVSSVGSAIPEVAWLRCFRIGSYPSLLSVRGLFVPGGRWGRTPARGPSRAQ